MNELKLKCCPFCGGEAKRFKEYGDERNGYADFVGYRCVDCHVSKGARGDTSKPGYADNSKIEERAIENWNRRYQPEATKPAQDLSAAILALEHDCTGGAGAHNYIAGFNYAKQLAAAIASPADALVAGDRVDAERYRAYRVSAAACMSGVHSEKLDALLDAIIQAQKDGHG